MNKINTDMLISLLSSVPETPEYEGSGFKYLQGILLLHSDDEDFKLCLADFDFHAFELEDIQDLEDSHRNRDSNYWKTNGVIEKLEKSPPMIAKVLFI